MRARHDRSCRYRLGLALDDYGYAALLEGSLAGIEQLLLFVRMEPADKNVRADAALEKQIGHGHVSDASLEVATARCADRDRLGAHQSRDDRNIVWSKAPKDVLLLAYFSQVQPIGV